MSVKVFSPSSVILAIIAIIIVCLPIAHMMKVTEKASAKKVWREDMFCLNAGCVLDKNGLEKCIEFKPQVARVLVSPEPTPSDQLRMNVILLDKPCSSE